MLRRTFLWALASLGFIPKAQAAPPPQLVTPEEPAPKIYEDLTELLKDVHRWAMDNPGSEILTADAPAQLMLGWRVEHIPTHVAFHALIRLGNVKKSLATMQEPMKSRMPEYLRSADGRTQLAKILGERYGWLTLELYGPAQILWKPEALKLPNDRG